MIATRTRVTSIDDLVSPDTDLTECLDGLADLLGDEFLFQLIGKIRDHRGPGEAGAVRAKVARRMVDHEMDLNGGDERAAIRTVGKRLGYTQQERGTGPDRNVTKGGTLTNFTRLVKGVARTTGQPIPDAE